VLQIATAKVVQTLLPAGPKNIDTFAVAISPDGARIASSHHDVILLWRRNN
jgi:hypothetical protein